MGKVKSLDEALEEIVNNMLPTFLKDRNRQGKWIVIRDLEEIMEFNSRDEAYRAIWESGKPGNYFIIYVPTPEEVEFSRMEKIRV